MTPRRELRSPSCGPVRLFARGGVYSPGGAFARTRDRAPSLNFRAGFTETDETPLKKVLPRRAPPAPRTEMRAFWVLSCLWGAARIDAFEVPAPLHAQRSPPRRPVALSRLLDTARAAALLGPISAHAASKIPEGCKYVGTGEYVYQLGNANLDCSAGFIAGFAGEELLLTPFVLAAV